MLEYCSIFDPSVLKIDLPKRNSKCVGQLYVQFPTLYVQSATSLESKRSRPTFAKTWQPFEWLAHRVCSTWQLSLFDRGVYSMNRHAPARASPMVHVQDLVLDQSIDNSLAQTLSYYSIAPATAPYPHHVFSPLRTQSGSGYSVSRELRNRFDQLDDDYTDTLTGGEPTPSSPPSVMGGRSKSDMSAMNSLNSLFHMDDELSLNKYIAEIGETERDDMTITESRPLKKKTSKQKNGGSNQTHLSVKYHNLGGWAAESKEPKAHVIIMQLNEMIIFRESMLQALRSALRVMDKKYWMYCVERIKATDAGHTIKSEALVTLKNMLFEAQKHVAVLIAHARSLAIEIIEKVTQLRHLHARSVKTSAVVSIYWKGANYLLKIKNDMEFINDTPTVRIWLGFAARELIIPPHSTIHSGASGPGVHPVQAHDPKAHWLKTHKQVYLEWFKRHEAYILASWKAGKSKVIFKSDRKFLAEEAAASSPPKGSPSAKNNPFNTPGVLSAPINNSDSGSGREGMTPYTATPDLSYNITPAESASTRFGTGQFTDLGVTPLASPGISPRGARTVSIVENLPELPEFAPKTKPKLGIAVPTDDVPTPLRSREVSFQLLSTSTSAAPTPHVRDTQQTPSPFEGLSKNASTMNSRRSSMSSLDAMYAAQLSRGESHAENLLAIFGDSTDEQSRSRANTLHSEIDGIVPTGPLSRPMTPLAEGVQSPQLAESVAASPVPDVSSNTSVVESAAVVVDAPSLIVTESRTIAAPAAEPVVETTPQRNARASVLQLTRTATVAPAPPMVHTVPEWQQLKDYVKHSWGVVEIEEEANDSNNAFIEYKHGFHDRLHGINDSRSGFNDHKHSLSTNYIQGFHDAKHGFTDPVEGFQAYLEKQQMELARMKMYIQGKGAAPQFWKTVDHNPLVVEAAIGFEEVFPNIYLVPPMPAELTTRAEKCSIVLRKELQTEQSISEQRLRCRHHKDSVLSMVTTDSVESLQTRIPAQKSLDDAALLKLRQQGTTELLTGISVHHLSHTLSVDPHSLASLVHPSTFQSQSHSQLQSQVTTTPASSQVTGARKGGIQCDDDGNNVFLTGSMDETTAGMSFADPGPMTFQPSQSQESTEFNPESSVLYPNMQSFGSYIDTSDFRSFRIEESSKLRQRIEEKIAECRRIVEYKEGELFPVIRADRAGQREPNHASTRWLTVHAVRIQRVVRGFMGRRRAKKTKIHQAFQRSLHKVRTLVIGFMWRYRQREKYWEHRFEAFMMRKTAVKKFRGSMTLARFFRKIVRARRQMREDDERERLINEGHVVPGSQQRQLIAAAMTPVSRNVRRKHGVKLIEEGEGSGRNSRASQRSASNSPKRSARTGKKVTISAEVTHVTIAPNSPTETSPSATKTATKTVHAEQAPPTPEPSRTEDTFSILSPGVAPPERPVTPQERLRKLEADGPYDESKRREQLKFNALNLVARVNRGKVQTDTLHNSRLIPMQTVPNLPASAAKMRKFSTKEYTFMDMPAQPKPESLIKSSSDVFVGPIPKRIQTSASTSQLMSNAFGMSGVGQGSVTSVASVNSANSTMSGAPSPVGFAPSFSQGFEPNSSVGSSMSMRGSVKAGLSRQNSLTTGFLAATMGINTAASSKFVSAGNSVISSSGLSNTIPSMANMSVKIGESGMSTLAAPRTNSPGGGRNSAILSEGVHYGDGRAGSPGGMPGSGPLLRYNSSGLSLRSKKQQAALEKAEAERMQLRSTLLKYM